MSKLEEKLKKIAGEIPLERLISGKKSKTGKKSKKGGARPGSGRPPGGIALERRTLRAILAKHYGEEVEIEIEDPLTHKMIKMKKPRVLAMMERLYKIGIETGNDAAIDRWLNRALGKAPQPLIGDEEEDPIRVDIGADRILQKVYNDEEDDNDEG